MYLNRVLMPQTGPMCLGNLSQQPRTVAGIARVRVAKNSQETSHEMVGLPGYHVYDVQEGVQPWPSSFILVHTRLAKDVFQGRFRAKSFSIQG